MDCPNKYYLKNVVQSLSFSSAAAGYFLTLTLNPNLLAQLFTTSFYFRVTAVTILQANIVVLPTKNTQGQSSFPFLCSH